MTCSSEGKGIPKAVGTVGDNMVGPVKFKNTPVEVCQFSFFLDIIFAWKHQQEFKQFITHIYSYQKKGTVYEWNSFQLAICWPRHPKNFKKKKTQNESTKFIFITGSSVLPVLVRRWITRANCDKDLLISPAFVWEATRRLQPTKIKVFVGDKE